MDDIKDDITEVERPAAGRGPHAHDPESLLGRLRATAETGGALRVRRTRISGAARSVLKRQGYRLRSRRASGADGYSIAWCERIEDDAPQKPTA